MFSINNNTIYYDKTVELLKQYNNTWHSSIKMTPTEASKPKNLNQVYKNLYGDLIYTKHDKPIFKRETFSIRDTHQIGHKKFLL